MPFEWQYSASCPISHDLLLAMLTPAQIRQILFDTLAQDWERPKRDRATLLRKEPHVWYAVRPNTVLMGSRDSSVATIAGVETSETQTTYQQVCPLPGTL